ncbi:hypothetical protein DP939_04465 [Spongiactinospora rosea]|uniref:Uncharacterized protein n=1 Tax=Spongiactinospora rosea TaxID=2248750 RepID=A0A366M882_9ACTN|nr:hypothetical protein DP939_04465 [Spongiactinospora rosea]
MSPPGPEQGDGSTPPPPGRSRRTGLRLAALGALAVLAFGAPTVDRYLVHVENFDRDVVHTVPAGKPLTFLNVSWQVAVARIPPPKGAKPLPPERTWMKVSATRVALNQDGALRDTKPEVELTDDAGRSWQVLDFEDNVPTDVAEHKLRTPYGYTWLGIVPAAVADRVRVRLKPNAYRHTAETDLRKAAQGQQETYDVFVFDR